MDRVGGLLVLAMVCTVGAKIIVQEIVGPTSVEVFSENEVILDCVYKAEKESGVVVKWFYNGYIDQIYQWIPGTKNHGNTIGNWKDFVDTKYRATNESDTMYRALRLVDINPKLSGRYICVVSSYDSESKKDHNLVIYSPATDGLQMRLLENDNIILCSVSGVYPQAEIDIYIKGSNNSKIDIEEEVTYKQDDEGYNVTSILTFNPNNLTDDTTFVCEMNIPGTDYTLYEEIVYISDDKYAEDEADYAQNLTLNGVNSTEENSYLIEDNSARSYHIPPVLSIIFIIITAFVTT